MVASYATIIFMTTARPLRAFRKSAGMTLGQLGKKFGVNKSTVLRWEEGHVPPERAIPLEKFTGIPRHELCPHIYPPPSKPRERAAAG